MLISSCGSSAIPAIDDSLLTAGHMVFAGMPLYTPQCTGNRPRGERIAARSSDPLFHLPCALSNLKSLALARGPNNSSALLLQSVGHLVPLRPSSEVSTNEQRPPLWPNTRVGMAIMPNLVSARLPSSTFPLAMPHAHQQGRRIASRSLPALLAGGFTHLPVVYQHGQQRHAAINHAGTILSPSAASVH